MRCHPLLMPFICLPFCVGASLAAGADARLADAVQSGDKEILRTLPGDRANINTAQPDGTTALHWAVRHDDIATADALIKAGADVKAANRYGVTPMALAATNGNPAMIKRLLDAGADPNTANPGGETALMTAARTGKTDAVNLLLDRGAGDQREGHRARADRPHVGRARKSSRYGQAAPRARRRRQRSHQHHGA